MRWRRARRCFSARKTKKACDLYCLFVACRLRSLYLPSCDLDHHDDNDHDSDTDMHVGERRMKLGYCEEESRVEKEEATRISRGAKIQEEEDKEDSRRSRVQLD